MKKFKNLCLLLLLIAMSSTLFVGCGKKDKNKTTTLSLAEAKEIVLQAANLTYAKYHTNNIALTSQFAASQTGHDVFACFKNVEFSGHADLDVPAGKQIEDFKIIMENNDGVFTSFTEEYKIRKNNELSSEEYKYSSGEKIYSYEKSYEDELGESYIVKTEDSGLGPNHKFVQYAKMWLNADSFETRFKEGVIKEQTASGFNLVFEITLLDYITYSWDWSETTIEEFMQKMETEERYQQCYSNLKPTLTISFNNNNEFTNFELYVKGQQFWDEEDPVNYGYEQRCVIKPSSEQVTAPEWFSQHEWGE